MGAKPVYRGQWLYAEGYDRTGNVQLPGVNTHILQAAVSNDNAYTESPFRATKYLPEFPAKGVIDQARTGANNFVHWYSYQTSVLEMLKIFSPL